MKSVLSRVARAVLAAVTSPEAVKAEKSLAVLVAVRVLLAFGASAELVSLVVKALS